MNLSIILVIQIAFIAVLWVLCGFLNVYSVETIAGFFDKSVDFPLWGGLLIALVPGLGQLCIPVAAIAFILTFFL
jgi:hypothetical protein